MNLNLSKKTNMNITYICNISVQVNVFMICDKIPVFGAVPIPRYEYHFDPSGECALVGLMCRAS